jgi:SpoVK/Ycf46/Vps4 family AAA+-type ATPase
LHAQGFDAGGKRAVVIGATNRKTDLDPALLSRFDLV